ncbi:hypothetical protein VNO77_06081 [Canavalia gladiata]|uniref:Uncharacterized protein n=1 Tax=Canavalia gladiata TaxID=3824 RepID=A0AAN9RAK9_CANGL
MRRQGNLKKSGDIPWHAALGVRELEKEEAVIEADRGRQSDVVEASEVPLISEIEKPPVTSFHSPCFHIFVFFR